MRLVSLALAVAGPGHVGLASSMCGMDRMVRVMRRATGAALPDIIRMASLTPARLTGLSGEIGSLEAGKRADLVVLSRDLQVETVYLGGERFDATT